MGPQGGDLLQVLLLVARPVKDIACCSASGLSTLHHECQAVGADTRHVTSTAWSRFGSPCRSDLR